MAASLSMFARKCLCLPLMRRRWGCGGTPILPSYLQAREDDVERRSEKRKSKKAKRGCLGMRKDLVFQMQLLRSQGVLCPSSTPPTGHVFLSSVAVIRKGRSKGAAECHCNILALRAARVWPRVALWGGLNASSA